MRRSIVLLLTMLVSAGSAAVAAEPTEPPLPIPIGPRYGEVTGEPLNVRSKPSLRSTVFAQAKLARGDRVVVHERIGDWYAIAPPAAQKCWVSAKYIRDASKEALAAASADDPVEGTINARRLRVRARPSRGAFILTELPRKAKVSIIGRNDSGSWLWIRAPETVRVYVSASYVELGELVGRSGSNATPTRVATETAGTPTVPTGTATASADARGLLSRAEELRILEGGKAEPDYRDVMTLFVSMAQDPDAGEWLRRRAARQAEVLAGTMPLDQLTAFVEERGEEGGSILARLRAVRNDRVRSAVTRSYTATGEVVFLPGAAGRRSPYRLRVRGILLYVLESEKETLSRYVGKRIGVQGHVSRGTRGSEILYVDRLDVLSRER